MKIAVIVGARPNFIKAIAILSAMKLYAKKIRPFLVHTGQHYDYAMSQIFFKELSIQRSLAYLDIKSNTSVQQLSQMMIKLERVLRAIKPDLVLVVGDVNSTLAGALTASKLNIPLAHVEAGLRSFDRSMPEEINRIVVDAISDYCFTTCEDARNNLIREGVPSERIYFVGNVMIDTLLNNKKLIESSSILKVLRLKKTEYALMTLHRPRNVDDKNFLSEIISAASVIAKEIPLVFLAHPRTQKMIKRFNLMKYFSRLEKKKASKEIKNRYVGKILLAGPLGYIDFQALLSNAKFVMTDSGGIQEEATIWKLPCMTLRNNTERPITVKVGTNIVTGNRKRTIVSQARKILYGQFKLKKSKTPRFWDGHAAYRLVKILLSEAKKGRFFKIYERN